MRRLAFKGLFLSIVLISTGVWSNPPQFAQHEAQINYQIILKLNDNSPLTQELLDKIGRNLNLPVELELINPMAGQSYLVKMKPSQLASVLQQKKLSKFQLFNQVMILLNEQKAKQYILYASEDIVHPVEKPSRAMKPAYDMDYHPLQWDEYLAPGGVELESAPGLKDLAWQLTQGSPSVIVAVIDTGLVPNLDIQSNVLPGWNFVNNIRDVMDNTVGCVTQSSCHGTHVAGTIAALGLKKNGNTLPIGMGPQLKILPEKVFSASSGASDSNIINAMYWAVGDSVPGVPNNPNPAKVLNLSLGTSTPVACSAAYIDAINAINKKALIIFAAGNENRNASLFSPGNCANIISSGVLTIAATDIQGLRATYSNYGKPVTLAAPGGEDNSSPNGILSLGRGDTFIYMAGTSMAAPHIAGIAGLIYSYAKNLNMTLTPQQVQKLLLDNTSNFGESTDPDINCNPSATKSCGVGIVNAFSALKAVNSQYKAVFVPPSYTMLNLKNHSGVVICSAGMLIPAFPINTKIPVTGNNYTGYWLVAKTGCDAKGIFGSPIINGLSLRYGLKNQFTFIAPKGLTCQAINQTSIGCK
jgi:serine protease